MCFTQKCSLKKDFNFVIKLGEEGSVGRRGENIGGQIK